MVPLLVMSVNVMMAMSSSGTGWPFTLSANISAGLGQGAVVEMRTVI